jgi:hypothetical protein
MSWMPVRRVRLAFVLTAAAAVGCGGPSRPTPTTGLTGTVLRGPITPVCQVDVACDAPFSAGFSVDRSGGAVAHFRSDAAGHFTVWLEPGMYTVVPDQDAPVTAPASQARPVTVGPVGLTDVELLFDTGIR